MKPWRNLKYPFQNLYITVQKTFSYLGPKIWELVPNELKYLPTRAFLIFRHEVEHHLSRFHLREGRDQQLYKFVSEYFDLHEGRASPVTFHLPRGERSQLYKIC